MLDFDPHPFCALLSLPENGCNWRIFLWHLWGLSDTTEVKALIPCLMHQKHSKICSHGVCMYQLLSCIQLCNPTDYSLPGSSVHGILQARILEWVCHFLLQGSSWPRDWTRVSCIAGRFFTMWATREANSQQYLNVNDVSSPNFAKRSYG